MLRLTGFSLLEILIVLSIAAITMAMMVPSQKHFFQSTTAEIARDQLYSSLQIARNEAVMRRRAVVVCKSNNHETCTGEWRDGQLVKMGRKILYSYPYSLRQGQINWRAFPSATRNLVFLSTGFSKVQNGTFWYCLEDKKDPLWAIVLNQSGRVRKVDPDRLGHIYDDKDNLLHCRGLAGH
jgi:type IV fimbrial biogenesis protein FimT